MRPSSTLALWSLTCRQGGDNTKEERHYGATSSELSRDKEQRSYLSRKERHKHNGVWPYTPSSSQYTKGTQPNKFSRVDTARQIAVSLEKGGGV